MSTASTRTMADTYVMTNTVRCSVKEGFEQSLATAAARGILIATLSNSGLVLWATNEGITSAGHLSRVAWRGPTGHLLWSNQIFRMVYWISLTSLLERGRPFAPLCNLGTVLNSFLKRVKIRCKSSDTSRVLKPFEIHDKYYLERDKCDASMREVCEGSSRFLGACLVRWLESRGLFAARVATLM